MPLSQGSRVEYIGPDVLLHGERGYISAIKYNVRFENGKRLAVDGNHLRDAEPKKAKVRSLWTTAQAGAPGLGKKR